MENLNKSLESLEAQADELLNKSKGADDINPDDVSNDDNDVQKSENADCASDTKKSKDCADCDSNDDIEKSESTDEKDNNDDSEDDDDDDDDDDEEKDEEVKKSLEETRQDIQDDFESDADISKGIKSSEFQAAVVASIVKSLSEMQYDINRNKKDSTMTFGTMVKSLQAALTANQHLLSENEKLTRRITKLEKSMEQGFDNIMDSLDALSVEPAHMRKSVNSINVYEKNFKKSMGTIENKIDSLSKGEILNILTNELYSGNPNVNGNDIIAFESGAPLRSELRTLIENKCK